MFVTVGSTATISLAGDTSEGCKMLQEQPSSRVISCCFSTASREDRLCDPGIQSDDCRGRGGEGGFTLEEREGRCVLTLNNFTRNDEGTYKAMFNANLEDNKELQVMVEDGGKVLLFIVIVLVCIACFMIPCEQRCIPMHRTVIKEN
jgi:hypothetical protein